MTRLVWGNLVSPGIRSGVDRGVVYPRTVPPVVWNGLVSVVERDTDAAQNIIYYDGQRYVQTMSPESFSASVEAITYPDEIDVDPEFDFSYRTMVDNGYNLHLVYNVSLGQGEFDYSSSADDASPTTFKWDLSTVPEKLDNARACAHIVISSTEATSDLLDQVENLLYGISGVIAPRIPHIPELIDMFEAGAVFKVVDNGDGTWTATGPDSMIEWLDATSFQITSPSAVWLDSETYRLRSW